MYTADLFDEMKKVIKQLNEWQKSYDEGHPVVSDKEYDDLYFRLVELEALAKGHCSNSPTQKVIWDSVSELKKVKHNHLMLSLDKTKDLSVVKKFIGTNGWIAMCKMDGLTCSLLYQDGKLVKAETRGNGVEGEDVTHNAFVVDNIPKEIPYKEALTVDGEIICDLETFNKNFSQDYKTARNFAAGSIRLLDPKECAKRGLSFIAWDLISGYEAETLSDKLDKLDKLGFTIVPYFCEGTPSEQIEKLKIEASTYDYPIDGVVFKYNDIETYKNCGRTDHHFKGGLAFKFYDEEYETELLDIEWTMGRTGVLTPVAIYKDIDIDGTICNRASLHNISIMRELLGTYPDYTQPIFVYKANQIIPQISHAGYRNETPHDHIIKNNGMNMVCPICGQLTEIKDNDGILTLWCRNSNCEGKLCNVLDHFLGKKGLDIKGISKATIEKLIDLGWLTEKRDVFNLRNHAAEWMALSGFGEKSVNKILDSIDAGCKTKLAQVISAAGIPLIGTTVAKQLSNIFGTWEEFREAIDTGFDFTELEGFGPEMHFALHHFDYSEMDEIVEQYLNIIEDEPTTKTSDLAGVVFCVTGKVHIWKNRDELKTAIESRGGKVTDSVSSKTNYLINNDIESASAKNKKAKELGIEILTEEAFKSKFDF